MKRRRRILLDFCLLFLLAALLVKPYITHKYTDQWRSIESTFIADARFLAAHWPHPQPVVYHEEDDTIYVLPAHPLAHLVSEGELPGPDAAKHPQVLEPYIAALEDPARPVLHTAWRNTGRLEIDGPAPPGWLVAVSVNANPGWRATQDGREIPVETDDLGFIVLRPLPTWRSSIARRPSHGSWPGCACSPGSAHYFSYGENVRI